jgi:hypothetical protein
VLKKFDSENFEYHEQHCSNFKNIGEKKEEIASLLGDVDALP